VPHPDHLLRLLDSRQLAEWEAFDQLEPFGDWRADLRAGIVAGTIARANGAKRAKATDFIPRFDREGDRPRDLHAKVRAVFGGLTHG
jgi:hypothetical protein